MLCDVELLRTNARRVLCDVGRDARQWWSVVVMFTTHPLSKNARRVVVCFLVIMENIQMPVRLIELSDIADLRQMGHSVFVTHDPCDPIGLVTHDPLTMTH